MLGFRMNNKIQSIGRGIRKNATTINIEIELFDSPSAFALGAFRETPDVIISYDEQTFDPTADNLLQLVMLGTAQADTTLYQHNLKYIKRTS